jgi:hypothetical protein
MGASTSSTVPVVGHLKQGFDKPVLSRVEGLSPNGL